VLLLLRHCSSLVKQVFLVQVDGIHQTTSFAVSIPISIMSQRLWLNLGESTFVFLCPSCFFMNLQYSQAFDLDLLHLQDSSFSLHQLHETTNTLDPLDDIPTAEIRTTLVRKFKCSLYAAASRARIQEIASIVSYGYYFP